MPRKKAEALSFEEGMKQLQDIVEKLEAGELPLEESARLFKQGMELSKSCGAQLKKVQQDVKKIVETGGDDYKLTLFPEETKEE